MTIVMLIPSYEVYCKQRFLGLEDEGTTADYPALLKKIIPNEQLHSDTEKEIVTKASIDGVSLTRAFVEDRKINFQSFDRCKDAYSSAYGIKFGLHLAGINGQILNRIRRYISYRHNVVHASPTESILNLASVPREEPLFVARDVVKQAAHDFDEFVSSLHDATLRLRS